MSDPIIVTGRLGLDIGNVAFEDSQDEVSEGNCISKRMCLGLQVPVRWLLLGPASVGKINFTSPFQFGTKRA